MQGMMRLMEFHPSIYDVNGAVLADLDLSRPLFVQASRPPHFYDVVDVLHHRLGLERANSTLLVGATCPIAPWESATCLRRPAEHLSERSAADLLRSTRAPFSAAIITSSVRFGEIFKAMLHQGNLACFGHALEPIPSRLVNAEGQVASIRSLFQITDETVGNTTITGLILIAARELSALYEAAVTRPAGHAVEIGRFAGGSAIALALAGRASGRPGVTSVDIEHLSMADYFLGLNGVRDDIRFIDADSVAAAQRWGSEPGDRGISLLFIDGDHTYEGVARDLAAWTPYLVEGAIVALHDIGLPDAGVSRAAYYSLSERFGYRPIRHVHSMAFFERVPGTSRQSREHGTIRNATIAHERASARA
jgi:predicted O-methyltransferase YrrM